MYFFMLFFSFQLKSCSGIIESVHKKRTLYSLIKINLLQYIKNGVFAQVDEDKIRADGADFSETANCRCQPNAYNRLWYN